MAACSFISVLHIFEPSVEPTCNSDAKTGFGKFEVLVDETWTSQTLHLRVSVLPCSLTYTAVTVASASRNNDSIGCR